MSEKYRSKFTGSQIDALLEKIKNLAGSGEDLEPIKNILIGIGGDGEKETVVSYVTDAISSLHTVAKTGNINDLSQDESDYIVFDGGSSTDLMS